MRRFFDTTCTGDVGWVSKPAINRAMHTVDMHFLEGVGPLPPTSWDALRVF